MSTIQTCFNHSFTAWESWNLLSYDDKSEYLLSLEGKLKGGFQQSFQYQLVCSKQVVSPVHELTGPTGETNELYTAGRGVAVLAIESEHQNALLATGAILAAMLAAGNSVIVCSDNPEVKSQLSEALSQANFPAGLVQLESLQNYPSLIDEDIRNFALVGSGQTVQQVNQKLALRSGAITALVSETDLDELPQSQDPKLVLRFVTERTRTINITAVGGNATLLELGSDGH
ncbi:1-pyrroline-5-carboxylate dehydrogenase [Vibrio sp. SCSIO 43137]|uniref:1-pyrroline-5-carboxylate dehydrogenase n=1 Tax=Vibrio sp. SCSIO 43137 TaxID=3021011 RepID=UPI002306F468|nr:1-pyrroline-5-carboxylate dehydrogenase [Vibrio sp. SCSIO 43137]WCE32000.1 1-pyrroline-5-carboxylate dehydrogenase [Vibrio sp. SCSIO 43137]